MNHELKILPKFFDDICSGKKKFEIRKNDRNFQIGDYVGFREWDGHDYMGSFWTFKISYILDLEFFGWSGYVAFGIEPLSPEKKFPVNEDE